MSQATPESWEAIRARVAALLARRETAFDETAAAWTRVAHELGWSRSDVAILWDGLTEDLVRRYSRSRGDSAETVRQDVLAAMAALRVRVMKGFES